MMSFRLAFTLRIGKAEKRYINIMSIMLVDLFLSVNSSSRLHYYSPRSTAIFVTLSLSLSLSRGLRFLLLDIDSIAS